MSTKKCSSCSYNLCRTSFYTNHGTRDKLMSKCKDCIRQCAILSRITSPTNIPFNVTKAILNRQRYQNHFCEIERRNDYMRISYMLDELGLPKPKYVGKYGGAVQSIRNSLRNLKLKPRDTRILNHQKFHLHICKLDQRDGWIANQHLLEKSGSVKGSHMASFALIVSSPTLLDHKFCLCCETQKPSSEFSPDKLGISGLGSKCKNCVNIIAEFTNANDPTLRRVRKQNRKARVRKAGGKLSSDIVYTLLDTQNHLCNGCKCDLTKTGYHLDHIIPVSKGGANEDGNVQLLCPTCNISKGNQSWSNFLSRKFYDLIV